MISINILVIDEIQIITLSMHHEIAFITIYRVIIITNCLSTDTGKLITINLKENTS